MRTYIKKTLTVDIQTLPFGMLYQDRSDASIRGYEAYRETWGYDSQTQVSDLLLMGRKTETTTFATVAGTTGIFMTDSDQFISDTATD